MLAGTEPTARRDEFIDCILHCRHRLLQTRQFGCRVLGDYLPNRDLRLVQDGRSDR